jgi:hypothetical protein
LSIATGWSFGRGSALSKDLACQVSLGRKQGVFECTRSRPCSAKSAASWLANSFRSSGSRPACWYRQGSSGFHSSRFALGSYLFAGFLSPSYRA